MVHDRSSGHNMEAAVFSKLWGELHELMAYWCIHDSTVNTKGTLIVTALDFIDLYRERFQPAESKTNPD